MIWTGRWVWYADWDRSLRGLRPEEPKFTTDADVAKEKLAWPEFRAEDGAIVFMNWGYDRARLTGVA